MYQIEWCGYMSRDRDDQEEKERQQKLAAKNNGYVTCSRCGELFKPSNGEGLCPDCWNEVMKD